VLLWARYDALLLTLFSYGYGCIERLEGSKERLQLRIADCPCQVEYEEFAACKSRPVDNAGICSVC
jgi:hypothetical protein